MSTRFYQNAELDMNKIATSLVEYYTSEKYEVHQIIDQTEGVVQLKKPGMLRTISGLGKALAIHMRQIDGGLQVTIGAQDWGVKVLTATIAPITLVTSIIGASAEARLAQQIQEKVDQLVREQDPNIQIK